MTRTLLLVIGAMKAGSTSAFDYLCRLPEVAVVEKERSLLDPSRFERSKAIEEYERLFGSSDLVIDVSTRYTMAPFVSGVPAHAAAVADAVGASLALVYLTRDPVERLRSHVNHDLRRGMLRASSIDEALSMHSKYLTFGMYGAQIALWTGSALLAPPLILEVSQLNEGHIESLVGRPAMDSAAAPRSNPASDDTSSGALLTRVLTSQFYTEQVRARVPDSLRNTAKAILKKRRSQQLVELLPETTRFLNLCYAADQELLSDLDGKRLVTDVRPVRSKTMSAMRATPAAIDIRSE